MTAYPTPFQDSLDLRLERVVDVPPQLVWRAWTEPELITKWFTPAPWTTPHAEVDLRPGGKFRTVMRGPNGEEHDNTGCFLEVVPLRRLVFTDALGPGFRPLGTGFMTGIIDIEPDGAGTRYVAMALHATPEARKNHEDMGFQSGWGTALDQLVALARTL